MSRAMAVLRKGAADKRFDLLEQEVDRAASASLEHFILRQFFQNLVSEGSRHTITLLRFS